MSSWHENRNGMYGEQSITVIVINYNGEHHLEECLCSVQEAEGPIRETILVDDGSTDGSIQLVERRFPTVKVIGLGRNQGPAMARNAGIAAARTSLVCLLDNDVVVDRGWLIPLMEAMQSEERVAICTSRILHYEQPEVIGADGSNAHFVGVPTQRNAWRRVSGIDASSSKEVGATGGASLLIDKSRMKEAAYFDPDFFYNFEELDFCLRNRMLGYRCLLVSQSVVYHKYLTGGVDELSSGRPDYSTQRAYLVFRNRWYIILKIYALRTIILLAPALLLFEFVSIAFAMRKGVFRSYLRAWKSIIANLPGILEKRRAIQATKAVPDKALLSASRLTLGRGAIHSALEARLASLLSSVLHAYWSLARHLI